MWSWYLQGRTYVGMAELRDIRVMPDGADWWAIDSRDKSRKARGFGPYRSPDDAREAAVRRVAA